MKQELRTPAFDFNRPGGKALKPLPGFDATQIKAVDQARKRASSLVTDYYRVAPREWHRMPYEVKTLDSLRSSEITHRALAQTLCYGFRRQIGPVTVEEGDLYRICLQDHRILDLWQNAGAGLDALLTCACSRTNWFT